MLAAVARDRMSSVHVSDLGVRAPTIWRGSALRLPADAETDAYMDVVFDAVGDEVIHHDRVENLDLRGQVAYRRGQSTADAQGQVRLSRSVRRIGHAAKARADRGPQRSRQDAESNAAAVVVSDNPLIDANRGCQERKAELSNAERFRRTPEQRPSPTDRAPAQSIRRLRQRLRR